MNRQLGPLALHCPIAALIHPREHTRATLLAVALGLILGTLGMRYSDWPLWVAAALFLAVLLVPALAKWQADYRRYGLTTMGVSFLLVTQGLHSVEHLIQWLQYHALNWTMRAASGILSPANSEWVHFSWNWLVVIVIAVLISGGLRNPWAWLLLVWAVAHTLEHSYMFARYLLVLDALHQKGITHITAQGLPGILGDGGWLAQSHLTRGTVLSRLPGLTTAIRLDVHFWWNMGEMTLLALASHTYLKKQISSRAAHSRWQVT